MKTLKHLIAVGTLSLLASCTPYDRVTSELAVSEVAGLYRLSKVKFSGELDTWGYDRDLGSGATERALRAYAQTMKGATNAA